MALDLTFLNKATREFLATGLQNQLYDEMPLFKILLNGAKKASGASLRKEVVLARNTANGQVSGYGYVVTQEGNLLTNATMDWADFYYATVSMSLSELTKNSGTLGKEKIVDMLETKMSAAKSTLKENVYTHLFSNVTSDGGNNTLVGLKAAVGSTSNTYAGINRSTTGNSGWQPQVNPTAHTIANMKNPTSTSYLPTVLRAGWLAAAHDSAPNLGVTTKTIIEYLMYLGETNNLQLTGNSADLGFGKVSISNQDSKGKPQNAPIVWDTYCTANYFYWLTTSKWQGWVFPGMDFEPADVLGTGIWQRGDKQLAAYMNIVWSGQLLCEVPREQFVATSLGAS